MVVRVCDMRLQAAEFKNEVDHQRKVQLFFSILLTLLEHQLLQLREQCTPAALAASPSQDIESKFDYVAAAIRVSALTWVRARGTQGCGSQSQHCMQAHSSSS